MKKKIIYVDFIFYHKRVSYFKYSILNVFSYILKKLTPITSSKDSISYYSKKRKDV